MRMRFEELWVYTHPQNSEFWSFEELLIIMVNLCVIWGGFPTFIYGIRILFAVCPSTLIFEELLKVPKITNNSSFHGCVCVSQSVY